MAGLSALAEFYDEQAGVVLGMPDEEIEAMQLANVDLALKYAALKTMGNNTQMSIRCLELVSKVIERLSQYKERFSDAEAKLWIPALIFKVSQLSGTPHGKLTPS